MIFVPHPIIVEIIGQGSPKEKLYIYIFLKVNELMITRIGLYQYSPTHVTHGKKKKKA